MKVQKCKGMRDLSPADMAIFRQVEGIYRSSCSKWGYQEVRTPTIEYLHLFTSAGTLTPDRLGKVYSFLDWDGWSGERVVLRPDGTIPVARLYTESLEAKGLARLFYSTNIYIFEETGEKTRERWQCGAELIGAGSPLADTELILLSLEVLNELGLNNVELRLSHAGLIKALLEKLGSSSEERNRLFDRILEGDTRTMAKISKEWPEFESVLQPLLNLKGRSPGFLRNQRAVLAQDVPEISTHLDDFLNTVAVLEELGCRYQIDIASGTGFEYYTGMIFQLYIDQEKIGGGGRYDALISSMGGGDVPASGFALYLDSLVKLVKLETIASEPDKILVRVKSKDVIKDAYKAAARLRDAGYITEISLTGKVSAGIKWLLDITGSSELLIVTDLVADEKHEVSDINKVLELLEGEGGNKTGPA